MRRSMSAPRSSLQWGRRVNTAECKNLIRSEFMIVDASMGPPREHGGMCVASRKRLGDAHRLQWGRRVNTEECFAGLQRGLRRTSASMGSPREHGGMVD